MQSNRRIIALATLTACLALTGAARAADLSTLFTTPQERQIINSNRYKSDTAKPVKPVENAIVIETPIQQLLLEEVTHEYLVSGITLSQEGDHTVWINSTIYQDGAELDDRSKIKIVAGKDVRLRITAPDGKHYFGKSGETVEVKYMAPVED